MLIGEIVPLLLRGSFVRRSAWGQAGAYLKLVDGVIEYRVLGVRSGLCILRSEDLLADDWHIFEYDETPLIKIEYKSVKSTDDVVTFPNGSSIQLSRKRPKKTFTSMTSSTIIPTE